MKQGKVWGETRPLLETPLASIHELRIKAGSHCSMHRHAHKSNWFYCIEGVLRIVVEKADYALTDVTELTAGQFTDVPPGEYHRFEAETDVVALEGYYPPVLSSDIERRDCGDSGG